RTSRRRLRRRRARVGPLQGRTARRGEARSFPRAPTRDRGGCISLSCRHDRQRTRPPAGSSPPPPAGPCAGPGVRHTPGADGACRARCHPRHAAGPGRERRYAMKRTLAAIVLPTVVLLGLPGLTAAHPLGNFTTNRYTALTVEPRVVRLVYALDLAELPA